MFTIDAALVKQFNANIEILSQQKGSRLRSAVRLKTGIVGETDYIDQIGKTKAVKRTTRHGDTPTVDTEYQRRKIDMVDYDWGDYLDKADQRKMLADPTSQYVINASFALGRSLDDEMITQAFATSYVGKEGGATVNFPTSTNQIALGASGLSLNKLMAAKEILDANDVDPEEPRYVTLGSKQIQDLLKIDKFTSADFATVKALVAGARMPFAFMGFTFIPISNTLLDTDSNNYRRVICWAKNGLGLGIGQDITTDVSIDIKKNMATLVQAHISCGASRLDEDKVVEILCLET